MLVQRWKDAETEQMSSTVSRQVLHGEKITMARLELKKGCIVPRHQHPNEQISTILAGSLLFHLEGKEVNLQAGESLLIPGNVPHSAEAMEDCVAVDVFSPLPPDLVHRARP